MAQSTHARGNSDAIKLALFASNARLFARNAGLPTATPQRRARNATVRAHDATIKRVALVGGNCVA
eukprot:3212890-Lingulodinium_polyedra.AAC.1